MEGLRIHLLEQPVMPHRVECFSKVDKAGMQLRVFLTVVFKVNKSSAVLEFLLKPI